MNINAYARIHAHTARAYRAVVANIFCSSPRSFRCDMGSSFSHRKKVNVIDGMSHTHVQQTDRAASAYKIPSIACVSTRGCRKDINVVVFIVGVVVEASAEQTADFTSSPAVEQDVVSSSLLHVVSGCYSEMCERTRLLLINIAAGVWRNVANIISTERYSLLRLLRRRCVVERHIINFFIVPVGCSSHALTAAAHLQFNTVNAELAIETCVCVPRPVFQHICVSQKSKPTRAHTHPRPRLTHASRRDDIQLFIFPVKCFSQSKWERESRTARTSPNNKQSR